jgi:hypothetical protein
MMNFVTEGSREKETERRKKERKTEGNDSE